MVSRRPLVAKGNHKRQNGADLVTRFPKKLNTRRSFFDCPIVATMKLLGNDWNMIAIRYLHDRPMKFNELKREIGVVSSKTLSRTLKNLAAENLVRRRVLDTAPVSVEYSLTLCGKELSDSLFELRKWGKKWLKNGDKEPAGDQVWAAEVRVA